MKVVRKIFLRFSVSQVGLSISPSFSPFTLMLKVEIALTLLYPAISNNFEARVSDLSESVRGKIFFVSVDIVCQLV
jgi:hypothetical protein